jgi:hypothetical protein
LYSECCWLHIIRFKTFHAVLWIIIFNSFNSDWYHYKFCRCPTCGVGFITQYDLKRHQRGHRLYVCDCGQEFKNWTQLQTHTVLSHPAGKMGWNVFPILINESIKPSTQQFLYNKHSYNEICHFTYHYMFRSISWPSSGGSAYVNTLLLNYYYGSM